MWGDVAVDYSGGEERRACSRPAFKVEIRRFADGLDVKMRKVTEIDKFEKYSNIAQFNHSTNQ